MLLLAGVLLAVFGYLYVEAVHSNAPEGVRLLRWALIGYAVIYGLLVITTFLV